MDTHSVWVGILSALGGVMVTLLAALLTFFSGRSDGLVKRETALQVAQNELLNTLLARIKDLEEQVERQAVEIRRLRECLEATSSAQVRELHGLHQDLEAYAGRSQ